MTIRVQTPMNCVNSQPRSVGRFGPRCPLYEPSKDNGPRWAISSTHDKWFYTLRQNTTEMWIPVEKFNSGGGRKTKRLFEFRLKTLPCRALTRTETSVPYDHDAEYDTRRPFPKSSGTFSVARQRSGSTLCSATVRRQSSSGPENEVSDSSNCKRRRESAWRIHGPCLSEVQDMLQTFKQQCHQSCCRARSRNDRLH